MSTSSEAHRPPYLRAVSSNPEPEPVDPLADELTRLREAADMLANTVGRVDSRLEALERYNTRTPGRHRISDPKARRRARLREAGDTLLLLTFLGVTIAGVVVFVAFGCGVIISTFL